MTNINADFNRKKTDYPNIANLNNNTNADLNTDVEPNETNVNLDFNPEKKTHTKGSQFEEIKKRFQQADVDEKIDIYTTTSGLSVEQFKELLRLFPLQYLDKLERAMEE